MLVALAALAVTTPTFDRSSPAGALTARSGPDGSAGTQDAPNSQDQGPQTAVQEEPVTPSGPDQAGAELLTQPAHPPLALTPPTNTAEPGKHSGGGSPAPMHSSGDTSASVSQLTSSGIPQAALLAYHNAAADLRQSAPGCHLPWALLAGIGRVESDHGEFGGAALQADGNETKPIVGPALDGVAAGMATITDTDQGLYDGDTSYDRAVGPMQFLPSTWEAVGVDADGNGTADPQNIFDAAASTGVYLCAGGSDLSTIAGQEAAVLRYNHSQSYVDLVLSLMRAYAEGESGIVLPDANHPIAPDTLIAPPTVTGEQRHREHQREKQQEKEREQRQIKQRTRTKKTQRKTRSITKKHKAVKQTKPPVKRRPTPPAPPEPTPRPQAPSAPREVHAVPVLTGTGPALELDWTAPATVGSGVAGYRVKVVSAAGTPVGGVLSVGSTSTALTLPNLPDRGVYTVSVTAWSARGKLQASSPAAFAAVATLEPANLTGTEVGSKITAAWDWDAATNAAIMPSGFVVRVLNTDGTTAVEQSALASDRDATLTLPDGADPTAATKVEVWATFTGSSGPGGVTPPVVSDVTVSDPPSDPPPSDPPPSDPPPSDTPGTPTSSPSSTGSSPVPSGTSPSSATPTPSN